MKAFIVILALVAFKEANGAACVTATRNGCPINLKSFRVRVGHAACAPAPCQSFQRVDPCVEPYQKVQGPCYQQPQPCYRQEVKQPCYPRAIQPSCAPCRQYQPTPACQPCYPGARTTRISNDCGTHTHTTSPCGGFRAQGRFVIPANKINCQPCQPKVAEPCDPIPLEPKEPCEPAPPCVQNEEVGFAELNEDLPEDMFKC